MVRFSVVREVPPSTQGNVLAPLTREIMSGIGNLHPGEVLKIVCKDEGEANRAHGNAETACRMVNPQVFKRHKRGTDVFVERIE